MCIKDRTVLYPSGWSDLGVKRGSIYIENKVHAAPYFQLIAFQIATECEISSHMSPFKYQPLLRQI